MSEADVEVEPRASLRVAIQAADPERRALLQRIVSRAGHQLVAAAGSADVLLADGDKPLDPHTRYVILGAGDAQSAGWLSRESTLEQIDAALRAVAAGLIVRAPGDAAPGFAPMPEFLPHSLLTPREVEVLTAIGRGLGNKAIARQLKISLHTVKFHVEALFRKLGARSRSEAVAKGLARRKAETINI